MENKLFYSTLAKKKQSKTYLVLFWDNAEYLGLYLACSKLRLKLSTFLFALIVGWFSWSIARVAKFPKVMEKKRKAHHL